MPVGHLGHLGRYAAMSVGHLGHLVHLGRYAGRPLGHLGHYGLGH